MKTITFKNSEKMQISDKVADVIGKRIMEGCKTFQVFMDGDNNNMVTHIVNVEEIAFMQ